MGRLMQWVMIGLLPMGWQQTAWADEDHEQVLELRQSGQILPLEKILAISRQRITGRIIEVELEREEGILIYELEILDAHDKVWSLEIDAMNGRILKIEED